MTQQASYDVVVQDPIALDPAYSVLQAKVGQAASAREAIEGADAMMVAILRPDHRRIDPSWFDERRGLVVDCWRALPEEIAKTVEIVHVRSNERVRSKRVPAPPLPSENRFSSEASHE